MEKLNIVDFAVNHTNIKILNEAMMKMPKGFITRQWKKKVLIPVIILLSCRKFSYPLTMKKAIKTSG